MIKDEKKIVKSQFERVDDFNPVSVFDNEIQEKWIHKPIVVKTGEGEDDFIIEEKAVCIEKVNIRKQIQEEAKTTDLKELLRQFALSGDESIFNRREGVYVDVTKVQEAAEEHGRILTPEEVKATLPAELQELSVEQLASMSMEDINNYFIALKAKEAEKQIDEVSVNDGKEK